VSALWITNSRNEILLAKRALNKSHDPGQWGPAVAGTVDQGETYDFNIIKEAREELGLSNLDFKIGPKERRSGRYNYFVQWYQCQLDKPVDEFVINKDEVAEIKWFAKDFLLKEIQAHPDKFLKSMQSKVELFGEK